MKLFTKKKSPVIKTTYVALMLGSIGLFANYYKTSGIIKQYKKKIKALQKKQQILSQTKKQNNSIHKKLRMSRQHLMDFDKTLHTNNETSQDQMIQVAHYARKNNLRLQSLTSEKEKQKPWFKKQNVNYTVAGTNKEIGLFVKKIKYDKTVKCKTLKFNTQIENKSNLTCTLQFLTIKF